MIEYIFGGVLLVLAVVLIVVTMLQKSKDKQLSGTIAGGADSFFGNSKATKNEKTLQLITTVVSIVFMITVVAMYIVVS